MILTLLSKISFAVEMTLCSPLNGQLLSQGVPSSNKEIVRKFKGGFKNTEGQQIALTDINGHFSFPAVTEKSFWAGLVPHEAVITQSISITNSFNEDRLLQFVKRDYEVNSEYGIKYGGQIFEFILDSSLEIKTLDLFENPPKDKTWLKKIFTFTGKIKNP